MTRPLLVEEESGTFTGRYHPHNGYHAGDFGTGRLGEEATSPTWLRPGVAA